MGAATKTSNEYRVVLIGDSSVWGYLLKPENTLAAYINAANLQANNGRIVRAYNLGYPTLSLAKDLMILSDVMRYEPDMIIWLMTLESFPVEKQLDSPIIQNNPTRVREVISKYSLNLDPNDPRFVDKNFLGSSLVGQRRALADLLHLQLYGVLWAATGIDQYYPESYDPPQKNLDKDESFHSLQPPRLNLSDLSLEILTAGTQMAENLPIIFVNEPIYISQGYNSDIRYNFFYPRWVYDQYRLLFAKTCQENEWHVLHDWNLLPNVEFTNRAIHMTPFGTQQLASELEDAIQEVQQR